MGSESFLLHHLISASTEHAGERCALKAGDVAVTYAELQRDVERFAHGVLRLGLGRAERIAIYMEKRPEAVISSFGATAAGGVFVPVNPLLKPEQVSYILRDCNVRILVTTGERLDLLGNVLPQCPDLRQVVVTGTAGSGDQPSVPVMAWSTLLAAPACSPPRVIDADMAAILYTSGSTGKPKGVVLSHRNMVAGAKSVASYLDNHRDDRILAALPLSFDAGFSQLTTAFHVGACAVLLNYLMPRDVLKSVVGARVTGLTGVPPLWIQLAQQEWPESVGEHLRYIANTGGRMPLATLRMLGSKLPRTQPFLMYGLTEAFRSTYLPPQEVDRRPDSIGKAIPNAEILVLREDGSPCAPEEPGELVHRGALVALGYWNDPEKTAERFKPLRPADGGLTLTEIAVFSGDTVRKDDEGFLYFVGRRDEMIKTSGYRVSPTELEEVLYSTQLVGEAAAFGVAHPVLGQAIVVVATPREGVPASREALLAECRQRLPAYMVPAEISLRPAPLPRNANGKIDRKLLAAEFVDLFQDEA